MSDDAVVRRRLLEGVLAGDLDVSDEMVQAAMRADGEFARELAGLQRMQAHLDRQAAIVRADLAHRDEGLEAAIEARVRRRASRAGRAVSWRSGRLPWLLAAALLVIALVAWPREGAGKPPQYLGSIPVAPTADGRGLQFRFDLPTQGSFVVGVLDHEGRPAFPPVEVDTATWVPAAALVARWPAESSVRVEAFTADGVSIGTGLLRWSPPR